MLVLQTRMNRYWSRRGTFAFIQPPLGGTLNLLTSMRLPCYVFLLPLVHHHLPPRFYGVPSEVLSFSFDYKCAVGLEPCVILYLMTFNVCARFLTSTSFALERPLS
jgi:hypothetical protein